MSNEEEQSFTVRDRRRFTAEETEQTEAAAPTPAEAPVSQAAPEEIDEMQDFEPAEDGGEEYSGELPDVHALLAMFLSELRSLAWLRMGLVANPSTGQIERDLDQAKTAIDTVVFLASQLEQVISADERLPLKALVTDLQMNYVEQKKKG